MLGEDWATSMPKKYMSGSKSFVYSFLKMSFETFDTFYIVSIDNNVFNIDHKKDVPTDGGKE